MAKNELTLSDQAWLQRMDAAFDREDRYKNWLAGQNVELSRLLDERNRQIQKERERAQNWQCWSITMGFLLLITWAGLIWGITHP